MNVRGPSNSLSINETSIPHFICSRSLNSVFSVFLMFFKTKKKFMFFKNVLENSF